MQGVKWGTCQITGATHSEGALVPEVTISGTGRVTVGEFLEWSNWEVSITQPKPFYGSLTSLQIPKQLKTSKVQTRNKYVTTAVPFLFKHRDSLYLYKIKIQSLHQHQTHLQTIDLFSLPRCSLKLLLPLFQGLLT